MGTSGQKCQALSPGTATGLRDMYVLVWLCMTTREVIASEATLHPNAAWVEKQAEAFAIQTAGMVQSFERKAA